MFGDDDVERCRHFEGEEITVNYNGSPEDRSPVWFEEGFKKR